MTKGAGDENARRRDCKGGPHLSAPGCRPAPCLARAARRGAGAPLTAAACAWTGLRRAERAGSSGAAPFRRAPSVPQVSGLCCLPAWGPSCQAAPLQPTDSFHSNQPLPHSSSLQLRQLWRPRRTARLPGRTPTLGLGRRGRPLGLSRRLCQLGRQRRQLQLRHARPVASDDLLPLPLILCQPRLALRLCPTPCLPLAARTLLLLLLRIRCPLLRCSRSCSCRASGARPLGRAPLWLRLERGPPRRRRVRLVKARRFGLAHPERLQWGVGQSAAAAGHGAAGRRREVAVLRGTGCSVPHMRLRRPSARPAPS